VIGVLFYLFVLVDGLVGRNPQAWAGPVRGIVVSALALAGLVGLVKARISLSPINAAVVGVMAALTISDVVVHVNGLSVWVMYAGVYLWQSIVVRDWVNDFALAAVIIVALVAVVILSGVLPPQGAWNRNVVGGTLAALLPASWKRWRWLGLLPVLAAVALTGSRGAIVAALVACAVLYGSWRVVLWAAPAAIAGLAGLIAWRPVAAGNHIAVALRAIQQWWATSPWWGVGPGNISVQSLWDVGQEISGHNLLVDFAAQVGVVGMLVAVVWASVGASGRIGKPVAASGGRMPLPRWQWATLAVIATHGLVENTLAWWPVGVIAALVMV
jgi:hypothetical protein